MTNQTIGADVAPGQDGIVRRLENVERRLREIASVRSLQTSAIGSGGLTVNPGGVGVALRVDQYDGSQGGPPGPAGTLAFTSASGRQTTIRNIDAAAPLPPALAITTAPDSNGATTQFELSSVGLITGLPYSGGSWSLSLIKPGGPTSPGFTVQTGTTIFYTDTQSRLVVNSSSWVANYNNGTQEWQARDADVGSYIGIRASGFQNSSSRAVKDKITALPFDPNQIVQDAPAYEWQYKESEASDQSRHVSPMADDLPPLLVSGEGAERSVDQRDLLGVLWAAHSDLLKQHAALQQRVTVLEGK